MKIKIKEYEYEIIEADKDNKELKSQAFGVTEFNECKIYLMADANPITKRVTLIHELAHAFMFAYGHYYNANENYSFEHVCELFGVYADDIIKITDDYFKSKSLTENEK